MHVFLDHINTSICIPWGEKIEDEAWRHTLVQPIKIPNLDHVGVKNTLLEDDIKNNGMNTTVFHTKAVMQPDGSVSSDLKQNISKQVIAFMPKNCFKDANDIKYRDIHPYFSTDLEKSLVNSIHNPY